MSFILNGKTKYNNALIFNLFFVGHKNLAVQYQNLATLENYVNALKSGTLLHFYFPTLFSTSCIMLALALANVFFMELVHCFGVIFIPEYLELS